MALEPYQRFWWLAAAISFVSLVAVLWFQWGQHRIRSFRMRRPFNCHLTNDNGSSVIYEMHWPRDSEVLVQLRMAPRLNYTRHELVFGFHGKDHEKPIPVTAVNTFIKIGKRREQSPEENEAHSIDHKDRYHIKETVEQTVKNVFTTGFRVQTRNPGRYPILLEIITDCGEGKPVDELVLIVEDR